MAKNFTANCVPSSVNMYVVNSYGIIQSRKNIYATHVVVIPADEIAFVRFDYLSSMTITYWFLLVFSESGAKISIETKSRGMMQKRVEGDVRVSTSSYSLHSCGSCSLYETQSVPCSAKDSPCKWCHAHISVQSDLQKSVSLRVTICGVALTVIKIFILLYRLMQTS